MAREFRFIGTTSDRNECPVLYELPGDRVAVQGELVTDPDELAQMVKFGEADAVVVVPRELLTRFAPKQ
ncbi:hypothetical protein P3T36_000273 [Kitasatospora sp. MAP12-15]|uniref:hypothetical protein n=1 Tax=unclassified Kitasatospora TaxID=2633591 RepID=UPI002474FC03|nr:hypothetical protein [Kitasatospora sp. MAP12-44]MDH6109502.1 hypothetical protein [Kitasatospora sp. MAP12-44]